jgi:poly(beta-D-mannuronate) lyase
MKYTRWMAAAFCLALAASIDSRAAEYLVNNPTQFNAAVASAQPGDHIVLAEGEWVDAYLNFRVNGTQATPIVLRAQTPGKTVLTGTSSLWIDGRHLVVDGLFFKDGALPPGNTAIEAYVIRFLPGSSNCRLTRSAIIDYSPSDINQRYFWVGIQGTDHRVDHNHFSGQNHLGVTVVMFLAGQPVNHRIDNNFIGNRPPGNGNGFEAMTIGRIAADLPTPARVTVERNLFYRCSGEGEIISNKSSENRFLGNTFVESQGALVFRQGNRSVADGNFFLGNGVPECGGIRQHLAEYLARVARGERLFVTLRGRVIAEISPPTPQPDAAGAARGRLKGSLLRYDQPFEPVLPADDWDMNR